MTNGQFEYECPKCKHKDHLRANTNDDPLAYPTCTNPKCRYGYGEKTGMSFTGYRND